jgi:hypothetical protein
MSGTQSSSSGRSSSGTSGREKSKAKQKPEIKPEPSRWRFLVRFLIFFAAAFLLWKVSAPILNKSHAFTSEIIVKILDSHNITRTIKTSGSDLIVVFYPSPDGQPLVIDSIRITYNTVFLVALIMAVPDIRPRLRLKIMLLGILILFPIQIFRITVIIFYFYSMRIQLHGDSLYPSIIMYGLHYSYEAMRRLSGMLFPAVIWAGLFYYYKWHRIFKKKYSNADID